MLAATRRRGPRRLAVRLAAGTLLSLALLVFSLTPAGADVRTWVLDQGRWASSGRGGIAVGRWDYAVGRQFVGAWDGVRQA